ncbi:MAG: class I poly(R)-hydroxyalkanoic acid synthase, partial [Alcanivoracaceae bacterium]|nr:class I poly(R)-hydroxyalkanoic acid synthase [Alcanivoracaceae bacterium]
MNDSGDNKADSVPEMLSYLSRIGSDFLSVMQERLGQSTENTGTSVFFEMMENYRRFCSSQVEHPGNIVDRQVKLWQQQMGLWNAAILRMSGQEVPLSIPTPKGDKRFSDPDWENNPVFNFFRESYLLQSDAIMATIDEASGIDESTRSRLKFFTRQIVNAAAPSNYPATNPEVLKLTVETAGKNLADGLKNLADDLHRSADVLNIRMTDYDAFELGVDVASTPGKVIFRNRLIELIQYSPSTKDVHRTPLLMVPPWVNKFYIMDLRESNSFVRWAVAQGHTVFMVSWVNPDASYRDVGIDQYLGEGLLAALDVISEVTGEDSANVVGYCAGGILLALAMAWLAAKGQEHRIRSATHFATLFDFS